MRGTARGLREAATAGGAAGQCGCGHGSGGGRRGGAAWKRPLVLVSSIFWYTSSCPTPHSSRNANAIDPPPPNTLPSAILRMGVRWDGAVQEARTQASWLAGHVAGQQDTWECVCVLKNAGSDLLFLKRRSVHFSFQSFCLPHS
jgi:hypothetical protein